MKILRATRINLFRWRNDPKYLAVAIYMVLYIYYCFGGICDYARDLELSIHPWIFPFLMRGGEIICPLMLGYVILIADAPFCNRQQQFILLRTGKRTWMGGQILYLFLLSVVFTALLYLLSIVFALPEIQWSGDWGSFITTMAVSGLPAKYGRLDAQYSVMKGISPIEATLWVAVVLIFVCFLLSLIMLLCNLWAGKGIGTVVVSAIVIMPLLTQFFQYTPYVYRYLTWISPISWVDRSVLGQTGQKLPSYTYAMVMPIVLSLILVVIAMTTIHRCNLDTDKE